jgi:hypothetical protein
VEVVVTNFSYYLGIGQKLKRTMNNSSWTRQMPNTKRADH